jgi:hypothetical protein
VVRVVIIFEDLSVKFGQRCYFPVSEIQKLVVRHPSRPKYSVTFPVGIHR